MKRILSIILVVALSVVAVNAQTKSSSKSRSQLLKELASNMVLVEGGTFTMGDSCDKNSVTPHSVTLSSYYICKYEVTQDLWEAVMEYNPSDFKGDRNPVDCVNWFECQEFIKKLNTLTGKKYRMPTEAEWEFAARGGNKTKGYKYSGSDNIEDVAWYWRNSGDKRLGGRWKENALFDNKCCTHPVGLKQPNELGLYDMSGNNYEWCSDWMGEPDSTPQTNPQGPETGTYRVIRGGSWFDLPESCTPTANEGSFPKAHGYYIGLRLVLSK